MKAKIAFIALALFAGQAQAEWELFAKTNKFEMYLDKSTIRKQSGYTLMWILVDYFKPYKSATGDVFSSQTNLRVAKCGEYQAGLKALTSYSGNMSKGDVVYKSPSLELHQIEFNDIPPRSIDEVTYNTMCGIEQLRDR